MTRRPLLLLACLALTAHAADEPWFKLVQSGDGYLAGGKLQGASWSFRIPGREIGSLAKASLPVFTVDRVLIQVQSVPREEYGRAATDPIEAQRKYEQDYMRKRFPDVKFSDHDMCRNASVRHGGWIAELPASADVAPPPGSTSYTRTPYQVFVTFQVADTVLVVGSAYANDNDRKPVAAKIDAICRSFTRER